MTPRRMLFAVLCFLWTVSVAQARPILFARTPHVSQGKIAFSYHDDI